MTTSRVPLLYFADRKEFTHFALVPEKHFLKALSPRSASYKASFPDHIDIGLFLALFHSSCKIVTEVDFKL